MMMPLLWTGSFFDGGAGGGDVVTYTDEAEAIFAAFTTPPTTLRKGQIDAAVRHLLAGPLSGSDIWAKLDMLQVYKAADSQAARVDWIDPTRLATLVNSPTFTTNEKFATNGTNSEIDTNYNPGDGGTYNFTRNSAHFGFWQHNSTGTTGSVAGWFDGTDGITIQPRNTGDAFGMRINQAAGSTALSTSGAVHVLANRSGASATEAYRDGIEFAITTNADQTSTVPNNNTLRIGRIAAASYTAVEVVLTHAGSSLNANEACDMFNAVLGYAAGVNNGEVVAAERITPHVVRNAWDSANRHFLIVGPDELWISTNGGASYSLRYTFPDSPGRIYGFFITSDDYLFVSAQDQTTGTNGRVYRSTDHGATFTQITTFDAGFHSGNIAFWPMVEDTNGDLYCGQYNVESPEIDVCKVWKSTDAGLNWTDVSSASWSTLEHVHGLGIDPVNGWIYATVGDSGGGIWRSKLKDGSDWVRKTTSSTFKYIPLEFDGTYVYAGDDEADGTIVRFQDDGTGSTVAPTNVLTTGALHNCYYLKRDPDGRFWACFPPAATSGSPFGGIYISDDGATWRRIYRAQNLAYADWYDVSDPASSLWTLHTGTTRFGTLNNDNLFPLNNFNGLKISTS